MVLKIGGHRCYCMRKHAHSTGIWGHAPPEKCSKLDALRYLLRPYLYPNATSPTRMHGRSNTAVCQNTHQSSQGISVAVVDLLRVGPDRWASYR